MSQPATLFLSKELVRIVPFTTEHTFNGAIGGNGGFVFWEFDTVGSFADRNQYNTVSGWPDLAVLSGGTNGLAGNPKQSAVGPFLDALVWASVAVNVLIFYSVDRGCLYRQVAPTTVLPANTPENFSGLRITGRFVAVALQTPAGGAAGTCELGLYVRSV